jgi:hypothetical protein
MRARYGLLRHVTKAAGMPCTNYNTEGLKLFPSHTLRCTLNMAVLRLTSKAGESRGPACRSEAVLVPAEFTADECRGEEKPERTGRA